MIMSESTRTRQRSGMISKFLGENSKQEDSPAVQFQAQAVYKKIEVKMEWSLHSSSKYTIWSSNIEN